MSILPENDLLVAQRAQVDKLIAARSGDAALLYLFILRYGEKRDPADICRALNLSPDRYERALSTLTALTMPAAAAADAEKPDGTPAYTPGELRTARTEGSQFAAVCQSAEQILGRTLTEAQLRALLTAYEHLGLSAGALIELLSHLRRTKGQIRLADLRRETHLWADMGITSADDAQRYVRTLEQEKPLSDAILRALGTDIAAPAPKAQRICAYALAQGFPPDAVALAVRRTTTKQGHMSFDYVLGILRAWEQKGIHTVSEITALEPETRRDALAASAAAAQPTPAAQLADWEKRWLEEQQQHKNQKAE